jgi:hypothetical protein
VGLDLKKRLSRRLTFPTMTPKKKKNKKKNRYNLLPDVPPLSETQKAMYRNNPVQSRDNEMYAYSAISSKSNISISVYRNCTRGPEKA